MNSSIIFDIDGTICPIKKEDEEYKDLVPYQAMITKMQELRRAGFRIVLFTSRNMRSFDNDINKILKFTKPVLEEWLQKWNIPYDEVIYGKPWVGKMGIYVDDRSVRPRELLDYSLEEIEKICREGRVDEI